MDMLRTRKSGMRSADPAPGKVRARRVFVVEIRYEIRPSGVAVISPAGVLDLMVAPALRQELHALVNDGAKQLLVDRKSVV